MKLNKTALILLLPALLSGKGYPWKIETYDFRQQWTTDDQFVLRGMDWVHSSCAECQRMVLYTHPQVKNRCLVESLIFRAGKFDINGGIWMKKNPEIEFVDCYPLNNNGRNDAENEDYGESHGISSCYASIGFELAYGIYPPDLNRKYSYEKTYITRTTQTYEWQWKEVELGALSSTAKKGDTLKNMFYDAEAKTLHYQEKVRVVHSKVVLDYNCSDD
jgi:hypothetical protein